MPDKLIGVSITVGEDGVTLDQQLYAESIIVAGMGSMEVRERFTPLDPGMDLSARQDHEEELDPIIYPCTSILGKLMFLAGMTRPDLANSVRELEGRAASPCMRHWRGLQHVLRYVAGTLDSCIHYDRGNKDMNEREEELLVGYEDSDWGTDQQTCRSDTGFIILLNGSPIAWRSKLQGGVNLSSSEAEWTAMHTACVTAFSFKAFWGRLAYYRNRFPGSVIIVVLFKRAASQDSMEGPNMWT
ncbi:unnamed protein product [Choristocarpus tenellus]